MSITDPFPSNIRWVSPYELPCTGYMQVLIATHKHSVRDWTIYFGSIQPFDDYKDYRIMHNSREIPKGEVLAVGIFQTYGDWETKG